MIRTYYRPVDFKVSFWNDLYKTIRSYYRQILKTNYEQVENSTNPIIEDIKSGRLTYTPYVGFKGHPTSRTVKELRELGAVYDTVTQTYQIMIIPNYLWEQIKDIHDNARTKMANVMLGILAYDAFLNDGRIMDEVIKTVGRVVGAIDDTMPKSKKIKDVSVFKDDDFYEEMTQRIVSNINGYTSKVMDDFKLKLIEMNNGDEYTSKEIDNLIVKYQGVMDRHARFIAKQEMALLTTKVKKDYYLSVGMERYIWRTVGDDKVRYWHSVLDGTIQEWRNPPIVNEHGDRKHPSEDYRCRCQAIPYSE